MFSQEIKNSKGVSLYLTVIVLTVLLAMALGLSSILIVQMKMVRGMEESVIALFAADTGVERILYVSESDISGSLPNGSSYIAQIRCSPSYSFCPYIIDSDCDAPRFCIKSKGIFGKTQRAVEMKY